MVGLLEYATTFIGRRSLQTLTCIYVELRTLRWTLRYMRWRLTQLVMWSLTPSSSSSRTGCTLWEGAVARWVLDGKNSDFKRLKGLGLIWVRRGLDVGILRIVVWIDRRIDGRRAEWTLSGRNIGWTVVSGQSVGTGTKCETWKGISHHESHDSSRRASNASFSPTSSSYSHFSRPHIFFSISWMLILNFLAKYMTDRWMQSFPVSMASWHRSSLLFWSNTHIGQREAKARL